MPSDYSQKVREQIEQYRDVDINQLPAIFHYWSGAYLRPILESVFGAANFRDIYASQFQQVFTRTGARAVASLGAGDAWMEVDIALELKRRGERDFVVECVELSDHLIARGRERALQAGVEKHVAFRQVDLNAWTPDRRYAGFLASQSLHHFVNLEQIFDLVLDNMIVGGAFVANDTIGRNGHLRWPETRAIIQAIWEQLPERYKYHHQLERFESPEFLDWDCSGHGFEGIRAQDILPELIGRFGFTHFAAWGGVIDVFIDRGFGHNYRDEEPAHRAFIDGVEHTNRGLLESGFIKPTQMCAVMVHEKEAPCKTHGGLSPKKALRDPARGPFSLCD